MKYYEVTREYQGWGTDGCYETHRYFDKEKAEQKVKELLEIQREKRMYFTEYKNYLGEFVGYIFKRQEFHKCELCEHDIKYDKEYFIFLKEYEIEE